MAVEGESGPRRDKGAGRFSCSNVVVAFLPLALALLCYPSAAASNESVPDRFVEETTVEGKVTTVEAFNPQAGYPTFKVLRTSGGEFLALYGPLAQRVSSGAEVQLEGYEARGAGDIPLVAEKDFYVTRIETQRSSLRSSSGRAIASRPTGSRGLMIAYLKWNDRNPDPNVVTPPLYGWPSASSPTSAFNALSPDLNTLDDWSRDASDGRFELNPVTVVELDLGNSGVPYDCPYVNNPANFGALVVGVRNALAAQQPGFPGNYGALGVVLPADFPPECFFNGSAAAFAFYSSGCSWSTDPLCGLSIYQSSYSIKPVVIHELGHNLDLPHAHSLPCTVGTTSVPLTYQSDGCFSSTDQSLTSQQRAAIEYGDKFEPMGDTYTSGSSFFNPVFSSQLGWLAENEVERISAPQDRSISLGPYGNLGGRRAIEVSLPKGASTGGSSPGQLWIEYRDRPSETTTDLRLFDGESIGGLSPSQRDFFVSGCPSGPSSRIYLRLLLSSAGYQLLDVGSTRGSSTRGPIGDNSFLLDLNPATSSFCDAGMSPGQTWTDPTGKLTVEFTSRTLSAGSVPGSASVRIKLEGDPSPTSPGASPTPEPTPESQGAARLGRIGVIGPSTVRRGNSARFTLTLRNAGSIAATGIQVRGSGGGSVARSVVPNLDPGTARRVALNFRFKRKGLSALRFSVTSLNAGSKSALKKIRVR